MHFPRKIFGLRPYFHRCVGKISVPKIHPRQHRNRDCNNFPSPFFRNPGLSSSVKISFAGSVPESARLNVIFGFGSSRTAAGKTLSPAPEKPASGKSAGRGIFISSASIVSAARRGGGKISITLSP